MEACLTEKIKLTFGEPHYSERPSRIVRITIDVAEFIDKHNQTIDITPLRNALDHVRAKRLPAPQRAFAL